MREKERINRILTLIEKLWVKYPDMRFFQIVSWLESEYTKQSGKGVIKRDLVDSDEFGGESRFLLADLFYVEDSDFEEFLTEVFKRKASE
ncbi:hypothetical protein ACFFJQ_14320 [Bacillus capparidis]|uniref:Uncharacterized protein n=1 Tax=Bacillus capparidis TaxID=1840411 RepID=A0ABS4CT89_9BACI|nr:hypothetical protein [Bacillus capparidis]MBP1080780.1 hypothetical protein [Bacillus capparidis]MED1094632.1 hypothetical protein [Bacillus capparidis]